MMPGRATLLVFAVALLCVSESRAQAPAPPACNNFVPLRQAVEKSGSAIQAASKRKAPVTEVCKLFQTFAAASAKMAKFMEENQAWCGIPDQAVKAAKANLTQAVRIRNQACSAAAAPRPATPSLSDALGAPTIATPDNTKSRRGTGTFDTLTGNALAR